MGVWGCAAVSDSLRSGVGGLQPGYAARGIRAWGQMGVDSGPQSVARDVRCRRSLRLQCSRRAYLPYFALNGAALIRAAQARLSLSTTKSRAR